MEVWTVGYYASVGHASVFGEGYDAACLGDYAAADQSAYEAFDAGVDDVFIIDRQGQVQFLVTLAVMDLNESKHRSTVDGWVRHLL